MEKTGAEDGRLEPGTRRARSYSAPALEKSIDILELLASVSGGLAISEMADRLSRSISEIFRVVIVMERRGWLRQDPESGRYSVTYHLLDVAFRATPSQTLSQAANRAMEELTAATHQSCHLVVLAEDRGMVVQRQESLGAVSFGVRVGTLVDLASSCSGHVLLAFLPEQRRDTLLQHLSRPAGMTLHSLRATLKRVRADGFELQPSPITGGVTDISYPIFGFDRLIAAALTLPYLETHDSAHRADIEETRALLRDAASTVSCNLGWVAE